jgi:two-component sensor histidine kinase
MSGVFIVGSWAVISLSLFNGFSLLWLGLTMFLVAEERRFGLWLVLIGMLMASLFFLSHTVILADQLTASTGITAELWWRIGWLPVITAPLLWYMLILWYVGFWEGGSKTLYWHRFALTILTMTAFVLLLLHIVARTIPSFEQISVLDFSNTLSWCDVPLMLLLFPPYAILCVLLPLQALRYPAPPRRLMGNLARQRARPWLTGASILLLLVAAIVMVFILYVTLPNPEIRHVRENSIFILPMVLLDLSITGLIAGAIVALGQAVVSYEIFTGKTLPRRGFARQWIAAMGFTGLISFFIGYCLIFQTHLIYGLITLASIAVTAFALLSWRIFIYRTETLSTLRPFVSGQTLMYGIMNPQADGLAHAQAMFHVICQKFLDTTQAQITPLHSMAALVNTALLYPENRHPLEVNPSEKPDIQQLDPDYSAGFRWQIPLWSERGLIGVLLLGDKLTGGLFTEEEIQVGQAAAERILDTLASEQIARRLVSFQRQRMSEQRVMDFRTRRTLHDETLPLIHTAILSLLTVQGAAAKEAIQSLTEAHQQIASLIHTAPNLSEQSSADFMSMLRHAIENEFVKEFEQIHWDLPDAIPALEALTADVLFGVIREAVRNAAVHGRGDNPKRPLSLWISINRGNKLQITIRDDGVGIDAGQQFGGSGSGLSLHSTLLALVNGTLKTKSTQNGFEIIITI